MARRIRRLQLPDGGWAIYHGGPPEVSASVKAYFVLKLMGDDPDDPHMARARRTILELGGIEATNTYTKIYLAIFGQYSWEKCPAVPPEMVLLPGWFYFNLNEMSSWSRGIFVPLSIIWAFKPQSPVPDHAHIPELLGPDAVKLLPVDSEHSAIFQCLEGGGRAMLKRIILTASGGSLRQVPKERLASVTPEEALNHPTWNMGKKITIDSATLMNKGLEVIEARWLFDIDVKHVDVIIHHQSIVHSLIEYADGSVLAQLAPPDMRLPILYALSYPARLANSFPALDLVRVAALTFEPIDRERFPCLGYAYQAVEMGGTAPAALNAANEVAVELFLSREIPFDQIPLVIAAGLRGHTPRDAGSLEEILAADREVREQLVKAYPGTMRQVS
ncbi:MAG: 1-deoxy-D-xylulose-5-phosphate reductoisomerase [candidate division NC10 bacterium]|nr:1-deoxy-D-xylulose-5-phosphate reductoisomerase [candidate division NC10 bacterium]